MVKMEELLNAISESDLVKRFKELDAQLADNSYYKETMDRLKKLQREIILKKESNQDHIPIEVEFNQLMSKFLENPTIAEYLEIKEELRNLLGEIHHIFEGNL